MSEIDFSWDAGASLRILTSRCVSLFPSFLALSWHGQVFFFFPTILPKWRRRPTLGTPPRQRSRTVSQPKWSGGVEIFLITPLFGISSVHSTATKILLRVQRPLSQRQHRHCADQARIGSLFYPTKNAAHRRHPSVSEAPARRVRVDS